MAWTSSARYKRKTLAERVSALEKKVARKPIRKTTVKSKRFTASTYPKYFKRYY